MSITGNFPLVKAYVEKIGADIETRLSKFVIIWVD
jgi:hypothetical protein